MAQRRRLMVVAAHPDDESLGFGGVLARYASEGVETVLVTATRGEAGRYLGHKSGSAGHPGREALAHIRERELHAAAATLGVARVVLLDYQDLHVDAISASDGVARLVAEIRRARPDVLVTFSPDGAYGHPDHIAISQLATAATVAAANTDYQLVDGSLGATHAVSKLYYLAWNEHAWAAYQRAFRKMVFTVDGIERQATPWPDWAITTVIDTRPWWPIVRRAVSCHESQTGAYAGLAGLTSEEHATIWGTQSFYRVFSLVNAGRARESDLFEGIRGQIGAAARRAS